ncbi:hypothetical protein AYI69_g6461 [Smittium culicis]|uniref:Uncharacterized protein n=1 Tax=Smittium culicis TaxID=133412 RepID=A0A1R1XYR3_9FUNG|nr:hypothetical protein AYI69_g6461 [Smittium culicis]
MDISSYSDEPFGEGYISEDDRLYGEKKIDKEVEASAYSSSIAIERTYYLKELRRSMQEYDYLTEKVEGLKEKLDTSERKESALYSRNLSLNASVNKAEIASRKAITELNGVRSASESNKSQFMISSGKENKSDFDELAALENDLDFTKDQVFEKLKITLKKFRALIENFDTNSFEEERNILIQENKKIEASLQEEIKSIKSTVSDLQKTISIKDDEINKFKSNNESISRDIELAKSQNYKHSLNIENYKQSIGEKDKVVNELKSKLAEQQSTLLRIMQAVSPLMTSSTNLEDSISEFIRDRNQLELDKQQLEYDKSQFMNAVLEMGKERTEVEKLRQKLKMHQINSSTAEFLSTLPPTPKWLKNADLSLPTPAIQKNLKNLMENTPISSMELLRKSSRDTLDSNSRDSSRNPLYGKRNGENRRDTFENSSSVMKKYGETNSNRYNPFEPCELYNCDHKNRQGCNMYQSNTEYEVRSRNNDMKNEKFKHSDMNYNLETTNGTRYETSLYSNRDEDIEIDNYGNRSSTMNSYDNNSNYRGNDAKISDYSLQNNDGSKKGYISNLSSNETMNGIEPYMDRNIGSKSSIDKLGDTRNSEHRKFESGKNYDNEGLEKSFKAGEKSSEYNDNEIYSKSSGMKKNPLESDGRPNSRHDNANIYNSTSFSRNSSFSSSPKKSTSLDNVSPFPTSITAQTSSKSQLFNSSTPNPYLATALRKKTTSLVPPQTSSKNPPNYMTKTPQSTLKHMPSLSNINANVSNSGSITSTPKTVTKQKQKFCTRPGCAAHYVHYHDDGTIDEIVVHELKPPVPKFQKTSK